MEFHVIKHFQCLADYNQQANHNLYDQCGTLTQDEIEKTFQGFTISIFGMLSHILNSDRVWMTRFQGDSIPSSGLYEMPWTNFEELRFSRREMDEKIIKMTDILTESFLQDTIQYVNTKGNQHEDSVILLLTHFFNHQTHHRGQVNSMLKCAGAEAAVLDMHRVMRPNPVG